MQLLAHGYLVPSEVLQDSQGIYVELAGRTRQTGHSGERKLGIPHDIKLKARQDNPGHLK